MFGFLHRWSLSRTRQDRSRRLNLESLEDRCMLTVMADVVFLFDASGSAGYTPAKDWFGSIINQLDSTLRNANDIDVRYGLAAFGQDYQDGPSRFAHSQVVGSDAGSVFDRLFSDGADHITDLQTAVGNLDVRGGNEDGWDAIDHAIAEYDFRPGAVPVFVLVQNDEGRIAGSGFDGVNNTLIHDGILAALKSKNVLLNTLTVGSAGGGGTQPIFDLAPYGLSSDVRILGVEADAVDSLRDGMHNYHAFNTATDSIPTSLPATTADTLQISHNGSNTGATGMVASGKSVLIGGPALDG